MNVLQLFEKNSLFLCQLRKNGQNSDVVRVKPKTSHFSPPLEIYGPYTSFFSLSPFDRNGETNKENKQACK